MAEARQRPADYDFHVVTIEGETQLWQVRATGPQVDQLSLTRGGREEVARSKPGGDGSDAVLDDLVLTPGDKTGGNGDFDWCRLPALSEPWTWSSERWPRI